MAAVHLQPTQAIIVAEWSTAGQASDRVAVYDSDAQGDPLVATRREFMAAFPRPWGAYFEPITGGYLFPSWGRGVDRVYVVQGFVPPPPVLCPVTGRARARTRTRWCRS